MATHTHRCDDCALRYDCPDFHGNRALPKLYRCGSCAAVRDNPTRFLEGLRGIAAAAVAQHPQYAGKFDAHVLVWIRRDVKTKLGQAFVKGELAIAEPYTKPAIPNHRERFVAVWSQRNRISTLVPFADVRFFAPLDESGDRDYVGKR